MKPEHMLLGLYVMLTGLVLSGCGISSPTEEPTPCPVVQPCPDCPQVSCPECPACIEPHLVAVPFEVEWVTSPHNNSEGEAFQHWNAEDPPEIPASCAKCHSTPGYIDFMGADGSAPGLVDEPAPIGTTIECIACHNQATLDHDRVVFPSGLELANLGDEAICLDCHQGLTSKTSVDEAIATAVGVDLDAVSQDLGFIDIHYSAVVASRYGTEVQAGYEYSSQQYDPRFDHVAGFQSCLDCHDTHTLKVKVETCKICHVGVASLEDVTMLRSSGSLEDYDGDGDREEPVRDEITGLQELLYASMQAYAAEVAGTPLVYDPASYPYFLDQAGESYPAWTGRLLRAAYNYQVSQKDPGGYVHGGKYVIQLLYDSISDLNDHLINPIDMSRLVREDAGHFAASRQVWRNWDEDGVVPVDCARCHSAGGLPSLITSGGYAYPEPVSSGLNCATCHDDLATFTTYASEQVEYPNGAVVSFEDSTANLCLNCHQGRESKLSLQAAIDQSGARDDDISENLGFVNPHYSVAGATLFGSQVQGAYEYDRQTYEDRFLHVPGYQTCIECHDTHELTVQVAECTTCHGTTSEEELKDIRILNIDFDGDGDVSTGIAVEVDNFKIALLDAIYLYAAEELESPIVYSETQFPHWFTDSDGDGQAGPSEITPNNSYTTWTPRLLRAVYNYTWVQSDAGAYAHNGLYVLQILYDTLKDIGGDVSSKSRPEATQ